MSKKLSININGKTYDVAVDGEFAAYLGDELKKDFNIEGSSDIKILLHSYVKKVHDKFMQEQKIKDLSKKLESLL